jgi:hypothetical protein
MDPEAERRYAEAFHFAVIQQNLRFQPAEVFAGWWARTGHTLYVELEDAWAMWASKGYPKQDGGEQ